MNLSGREGARRGCGGGGWPLLAGIAWAVLVSSTLLQVGEASTQEKPYFLEPISNVTVAAGRDVRLACVVDHLSSFKLAWIQRDRSAILTVGNHVITRNDRIGVSHDGHRTWYLTIKDVRPGDAGTYICQINTAVAISQTGHLSVVVPPYIKDEMSSNDVTLQEGQNVTLVCSARGSPVPSIMWRREDRSDISVNLTASKEVLGPLLHLYKVSRTDMGAYLCIASNGIPPSVSKRIDVVIMFLPTVYVPHQLVGVYLGQNVTIECYIEAWPKGLNYWKRPNGLEVLHSDNKYEVKEVEGSQKYKTRMLLTIYRVSKTDIGKYNCIANNSQGGAEQVVRVSDTGLVQPNRNTINKGGYETKENSIGKPAMPAVNWSKATEGQTPQKTEFEEHRKASQRSHSSHQQHTTKMLQNTNIDFNSLMPSPSSAPPSPRCSRAWATFITASLASLTLLVVSNSLPQPRRRFLAPFLLIGGALVLL